MTLSYFRLNILSGTTSYSIFRVVIHHCHALAPITSRVTLSFLSNPVPRSPSASPAITGFVVRRWPQATPIFFCLDFGVIISFEILFLPLCFPPKFFFRPVCGRDLRIPSSRPKNKASEKQPVNGVY
jgi:hypothetical protein